MGTDHEERYEGGCYCGAVRYELTAPPQATMVCHCSICRHLNGSAMGSPATFFPVEGFRLTQGADHVSEFLSPAKFSRTFCELCGTRLWMGFEKSEFDIPMVAIYTTTLDQIVNGGPLQAPFAPEQHAFYADRLYDCLDGKPKLVDMPEHFGGSGKMLDDRGNPI